jgi:hypothetical protein
MGSYSMAFSKCIQIVDGNQTDEEVTGKCEAASEFVGRHGIQVVWVGCHVGNRLDYFHVSHFVDVNLFDRWNLMHMAQKPCEAWRSSTQRDRLGLQGRDRQGLLLYSSSNSLLGVPSETPPSQGKYFELDPFGRLNQNFYKKSGRNEKAQGLGLVEVSFAFWLFKTLFGSPKARISIPLIRCSPAAPNKNGTHLQRREILHL